MQTCSRSVHVLLSLAAILLAACVETTTVATDGDRAATPFEAAIERLSAAAAEAEPDATGN